MVWGLFVTPGAMTCTVAEYVPRARLFASGNRVSVAGAVVELSDPLSQPVGPPPYEIDTVIPDKLPLPPFEIVTGCDAAVPMLWVATKLAAIADSAILADGTTNVTGIVNGLFVAVGAEIGTLAVYVPAASVPIVGVSVRVDGVELVESCAASQPLPPAPY